MNGKLSEHPLAELVREISLKELSGSLRLQHESAEAVVYFEQGQIVFAASNLRHLRLREYLRKKGYVSEKELASLANRADPALASALCAKKILTQDLAGALFTTQTTDILKVVLLWTEGTWEFDERVHLADSVRVDVDLTGLLIDAARRIKLEFVSSRFKNPNERISPVTLSPEMRNLLPREGFILSRVDGPLTLSELLALSGLREVEAYRTIYGLALGGFLERDHWSSAFRAGSRKAGNKPAPQAPAEPKTVGPVPEVNRFPAASGDRLDEFFERLQNATNHYEALNVDPEASVSDIKEAYYALARRYHPDRFHDQSSSSSSLHGRIESAFARITQAYETLSTATARSAYDAKLAAQEKARQVANMAPKASGKESPGVKIEGDNAEGEEARESDLQHAENSYKEGFAALELGQINQAVTHLAAAARLAPHEARYRAYYGRALAMSEKTRRLAEGEFKAAIKLDASNASYRVMLAEHYLDLGFHRRAFTEAERAVAVDPNNRGARTLLRKLQPDRKAV